MAEERYAYLASRYPAVTHTFIAEEVRALRALGVEVETFAVRAEPGQVLSDADERERRATHYLLPVAPWTLAREHLRALVRAPGAYLRTLGRALRLTAGGPRALLWQLFYFAEAMLLWAEMDRRGLRHVHVHFPNVASDVALLAAGYAGWTWSITLHGPTEFEDVEGHKLAAKVASAAGVICISDFTREQVRAASDPAHHGKLEVVRCGVDAERFAPAGKTEREGPLRVLNVAALSPRKGQRDLLAALADLRGRGHDVALTIVGGGAERDALEAEVQRLGLAGAVTFTGALAHAQVRERYAQADVFCLPSSAEGVPIVLMEAMACEVPVVATRINGIPELVRDRETGLLAAPGRPAELAAALDELLADAELRARLARAGREHVLARYELHGSAAAVREALGRFRARGAGSRARPS